MAADLTPHLLRQLVSPEIFRRGAGYHQAGRVHHLLREGNGITASVLGQELYRTRLQLVSPYHSSCTCPYEDTCKHVVALGLAWLDRERKPVDRARTSSASQPSLHEQVAALPHEALVALVDELLGAADVARPIVQGFLVRRAAQSYGRRPDEAAAEAALIGRQVREWLLVVPDETNDIGYDDDEYDEYDEPDERENPEEDEAVTNLRALVDGLCEPRGTEALPFSLLALSAVAEALLEWLGDGENRTLDQCLDEVVDRLTQVIAEPACPCDVALTAVNQLLEASRAAQYLRASERAYLTIASHCIAAGDPGALREACAQAIAAAAPQNLASVRKAAAGLLLEAGLRADALALLLQQFRASPSEWTSRELLRAVTPAEQKEYARLMLEAFDSGTQLDLRLELHLAAGDPQAAATVLARMPWQRPEAQARVAAALAPSDLDGAVHLWWDAATALIRHQTRSYYAQAAPLLAAMRSTLLAAGRSSDWVQRRNQLLIQYPRHVALHDELQRAGAW